jgi:hypothetical protein
MPVANIAALPRRALRDRRPRCRCPRAAARVASGPIHVRLILQRVLSELLLKVEQANQEAA